MYVTFHLNFMYIVAEKMRDSEAMKTKCPLPTAVQKQSKTCSSQDNTISIYFTY